MPQLNLYAVSKMTHVVMSADDVDRYNRSGCAWPVVIPNVPDGSSTTLEYLRDGIRCDGGRAFVLDKTFHQRAWLDGNIEASQAFNVLNISSPDLPLMQKQMLQKWMD
jgi:hypothetical protein